MLILSLAFFTLGSELQAAAESKTKQAPPLTRSQISTAKSIAAAIDKENPADVIKAFGSIQQDFLIYKNAEQPLALATTLRLKVYTLLAEKNGLDKLANPAGIQFESLMKNVENSVKESRLQTSLGAFAPLAPETIQQIVSYLPQYALLQIKQASHPFYTFAKSELKSRGALIALTKKPTITELKGHIVEVRSLAFSPDESILASGSRDHTVKFWDVKTGAQLPQIIKHNESVNVVRFSPDGKKIASGTDDALTLNDGTNGFVLFNAHVGIGKVFSVAFSPDGSMFASAGSDRSAPVRLWDSMGKQIHYWQNPVKLLAFKSDSVIAGVVGPTIRLFDTKTYREKAINLEYPLNLMYPAKAFSPDVKLLAIVTNDDKITVWDVESGNKKTERKDIRQITSLALASSRVLIFGTANPWTITICDIITGEYIKDLPQDDAASALAVSRDGRTLAAGYYNGTIKIFKFSE